MAVKLRLQRKGRKAAPFYHIVVADSRAPRDGRFIEKIGTYNPLTVPASIELSRERAYHWLNVGAQPTDTVNAILRFKGVLYQKHLQKGVSKGAFDQDKADEMLSKWIDEKESRIEKHREETKDAKKKFVAKVDGVAKVKAKPVPPPVEEEAAPVVEEAAEEVAVEAAAPVVEAAAPVAEAEAAVETPTPAEEAVPVEAPAEGKEEVAVEGAPVVADEAPAAEEAPATEEAPAAEEKTEE